MCARCCSRRGGRRGDPGADLGPSNYGLQVPDGEQKLFPTNVPPPFEQVAAFALGPQTQSLAKISQQLPAAAGGGAHVPVRQSHTVPAAPGVPLKLMQSVADDA
jgi:hypothetical protein